jgi:hypothetical protein
MSRKLLAVVLSSACLWTTIATSASAAADAAKQTPVSVPQTTASTGNKPPLPPGRAVNIQRAQGDGYDDLGPGVIIASWAAAAGALVLMMFGGDDDDDSSPPASGTQ